MGSGSFLGAVGVAVHDRVDHPLELSQRLLGATRAERQLKLVPDDLRLQALLEGGGDWVLRDLPNQRVVPLNEFRVLHEVVVGDGLLHSLPVGDNTVYLVIGGAFRRLTAEKAVQHPAAFHNFDSFLGREGTDSRPTIWDPLDQPIGGERLQRRTSTVTGDPVPLTQFGLDQSLAGSDLSPSDLLTQPPFCDVLTSNTSAQLGPHASVRYGSSTESSTIVRPGNGDLEPVAASAPSSTRSDDDPYADRAPAARIRTGPVG
jgi:hypothetical protein